MNSNDHLYLTSMMESIERIESYTQGGAEAFFLTDLIQDGVIRNLEILGEATKRLSNELRQANPDIPWKKIAGTRDVLIHDYLRVNLERVWQVVEEDIPPLKIVIARLLREQ